MDQHQLKHFREVTFGGEEIAMLQVLQFQYAHIYIDDENI